MPVNVIHFERLAYLSLVISMVAYVLDNSSGAGNLPSLATTLAVLATMAIGIALIRATARLRKNWLRWTYATLLVLGLAADAWTIPTSFVGGKLWVQALTGAADIMDVVCIWLLFSAASTAWFRNTGIKCGTKAIA